MWAPTTQHKTVESTKELQNEENNWNPTNYRLHTQIHRNASEIHHNASFNVFHITSNTHTHAQMHTGKPYCDLFSAQTGRDGSLRADLNDAMTEEQGRLFKSNGAYWKKACWPNRLCCQQDWVW